MLCGPPLSLPLSNVLSFAAKGPHRGRPELFRVIFEAHVPHAWVPRALAPATSVAGMRTEPHSVDVAVFSVFVNFEVQLRRLWIVFTHEVVGHKQPTRLTRVSTSSSQELVRGRVVHRLRHVPVDAGRDLRPQERQVRRYPAA